MPIKPDTFLGVCNTILPIRDKNLIPLCTMNLKLGTCWGVCNTPLPIRIKNLIPLWTTNLKPGTCWSVCNMPLPIRIKNLIPLQTMNLKLDTCWGVCNTPLPIRIKNLIPIYRKNLKPGTCWGVCNTLLPIQDKYLINTYLLNPILDKDWIVCIGTSYTLLTNAHDHGQMIDPLDTFRDVCNTPLPIRDKYLINTYLLNLIIGKDWIVRVGAYCIRHTNIHDHGQMIDPSGTCWSVCNTPLSIRDKYLINTYLLNPTSRRKLDCPCSCVLHTPNECP